MMSGPGPKVAQGDVVTDPAARWRLTEELFHRAMECPAETRTETLSEWCGPDTDLLTAVLALVEADSRVEELIAAAPEAGEFLERGDPFDSEAEGDPWVGRVLGAFRLVRLLGSGGMGVVYLGERVSGGFQQQVAVKLVGQHLRSTPAVEQFLLERETLARLEHRNIARLLDGGVTEEGFPYVAMEYIEGRRLDEACDDPATSIEQKLRWMLQLCSAVSYVHRNLILHRDLKPGNVMVTQDGVVKLLDFGTLKRLDTLDGLGGEKSAMTQAGMRPVTVRFASPEHIEGAAVSTAADVYSLGMMLYRLVAGRLPEELDDLPIGQYLRRLEAGEFKAPSILARECGRAIPAAIAGDLDAIVARALRFESAARYPTAGALAEDLISVLEHRPVAAREGKLRYRAAKFYRRNRLAVLAAAAALAVMVTGVSAMAWQGHVAHLQQLRADQGVEDERQLAHMLLFDYFDKLEEIPGSVEAERKATAQALQFLDGLQRIEQTTPGSALELDTIRGYTNMGNVLGNPYTVNLGNVPEAKAIFAKGLPLAEARAKRYPHDLPTLEALAKIDFHAGELYLGNGDAVRGEQYLHTAADVSARMAQDPKVTGTMLQMMAGALESLGDAYDPGRGYVTADLNKALASYIQSDKYDEMCEKVDPKNALCRFGLPVGQYKLGMLAEETDPAFAATHYQQGLASADRFPPGDVEAPRTLRLRNYLGSRLSMMLIRTGHIAQGMAMADAVLQSFRAVVAKDPLNNRVRFDLVAFATDLAVDLHTYGKNAEAEPVVVEALDELKTLLERSPANTRWQMIEAQNRMTYGRIEIALGRKALATRVQQQGLDEAVRLAQSKDASPEVLGDAAEDLLELHLRPQDAQTALGFAQRVEAAFARPTAGQLLTLAKAQAAVGQQRDAAKTAQLALATLAAPVKSKAIADEVGEAHKLIAQ